MQKSRQKLTIKDIAQLSGVSKSTVSRVLNQDPQVSPKTRQKVEEIIVQYGFQPSKSAREMRGIGIRTVGIIVSRLTSTSENQVLAEILPLLYAQQIEPIIVESLFNPAKVQDHLTFFAQRGVDGVILFAFSELNEKTLIDWQDKMVVIARHYSTFSSVYYDDQQAIQSLMQHFYQQGHRHIGYIGVEDQDYTTGYLRHSAYQTYCQQKQLTPYAIQGKLGYEWAYQQAQQLLNSPLSALICATDSQAIGVMRCLQEVGRTDIQVGAIGDNHLLHFLFPQVITIDLGLKSAGKFAVQQLLRLLEKGEHLSTRIPCHLNLG